MKNNLQSLEASRKLTLVEDEKVKEVLLNLHHWQKNNTGFILAENQKDLDRMDPKDPKYDG